MNSLIKIQSRLAQLIPGTTPIIKEQEMSDALEQKKTLFKDLPIKALAIAGGIIAALTFVLFVFLAGAYDSPGFLGVLGIVMIAASHVIRFKSKLIILDTMSIATYIAGLFFIGFGLAEGMDSSPEVIFGFMMLISIGSIVILHHYLFVFVNVLIFCENIANIIGINDAFDAIPIVLGALLLLIFALIRNEAKIMAYDPKISVRLAPVSAGLIVCLTIGLAFIGIKWVGNHIDRSWMMSIVNIPLGVFVLYDLAKRGRFGTIKSVWPVVGVGVLLFGSLVLAPAIAAPLILLLITFHHQIKNGFGLAMLSLIYFVGQYYYDLEFTLLTKSIMMMTTGLIFLLGFVLLKTRSHHVKH